MNKKINNRFTLIELLVVMGLMVLMVSLAMPAFSRMAGNNKVDVMASNIKTALEQGQSTAVSRNCYVAVVFPLASDKADVKKYNFGGYRLAEVVQEPAGSTTYKFTKWISEAYSNVPDGALMVSDNSSKTEAYTAIKDAKLTLAAADESNFTKMTSVTATVADFPDKCKAVIFKPTGECVNEDMYICIASADTGSLKITNTSDFSFLYLNQFTGRVEYCSEGDEEPQNGGE